nr:MAPEG family protein [uncultured Rhodoferax sp.]
MTVSHFTLAYWCVLVAALLPLLCAVIAKWGGLGKSRKDGGFDNHNPRAWLARQTDWRARANAAQANSFEALPFFIGAVLIAHQLGAYQTRLDLLAFVYVVLRVVYILMYVANLASLRSLVWVLALAINVTILFAGYR